MKTLGDVGIRRIVQKFILVELVKHTVNLGHVLCMILANIDIPKSCAGNGNTEVPADLVANVDSDIPSRETLIRLLIYHQIPIHLHNIQRDI